MSFNLTIESPDFDRIRKDAGRATEDAVRLLWFALLDENATRRTSVKLARDRLEGKLLSSAPTAQQNNFDTEGALVVLFTGSTAFNLTGLRNGKDGRVVFIHVTGTGTVTMVDSSASSDAANRIITNNGANKAVATAESFLFLYAASRWRQVSV